MFTSLQNLRIWQRITIFKCLNVLALHTQTSEVFFALNGKVNITIQLYCFYCIVTNEVLPCIKELQCCKVRSKVTIYTIIGSKWNKATLLCTATKYHLKLSNSVHLLFGQNKSIILNLEWIHKAAGPDYISGVLAWTLLLTIWMTLHRLCKLLEL